MNKQGAFRISKTVDLVEKLGGSVNVADHLKKADIDKALKKAKKTYFGEKHFGEKHFGEKHFEEKSFGETRFGNSK